MLVEVQPVRVKEHFMNIHATTPLVHRAFIDPDVTAEHHTVRLIPCLKWWMGADRVYDVNEQVTCVACIAAKHP